MTSAECESNLHLDDSVDAEIAGLLCIPEPKSFFLFAGAGSGKTRTLVNTLNFLRHEYGARLRFAGQRVGVITYTNAACDEIKRRMEFDNLVQVSTIHSFAWVLISGFNKDIREWLRTKLSIDIEELEIDDARGRPGTKASTIRKAAIRSKTKRLGSLDEIKRFTYDPAGDNVERDSLSHAEVIELCATFVLEKPLMQRLFVRQYPFLLVDESQDTNKRLVAALLQLARTHSNCFSLGLIGDTMQRIYSDGKPDIEAELPETWGKPRKKLNHRCPSRVVRLINKVRSDVDDHVQIARSDRPEGVVRLFVFPNDVSDKGRKEAMVRKHMSSITGDTAWDQESQCKTLALEHHMAAKRMGFGDLFESLSKVDRFWTGLMDGSLPIVRLFTHSVLPLIEANLRGDKFAEARIVREQSPLLSKSALGGGENSREQLALAQSAVSNLAALWCGNVPTCGAVLSVVKATGLFSIPEKLDAVHAGWELSVGTDEETDEDQTNSKEMMTAILGFLDASFSEVAPYAQYVANLAPFGTHQGVKGLEFERVMVIIDESETRGFMFGYDKFLGARELSETNRRNKREGKETTLDRTRRLFYVTCSRAKESLAVVVYSEDPSAVKAHAIQQGWFDESEVVLNLS